MHRAGQVHDELVWVRGGLRVQEQMPAGQGELLLVGWSARDGRVQVTKA